jgi:PAS domain S-box-containing protein
MQCDDIRRLLQRSRDAGFALNARGEVWAWNAAAEALTGRSAAEMLDQSFAAKLGAHGSLGKPLDAEYCECAIRDGGVPNFDFEFRSALGEVRWLNVSVLVFDSPRNGPALVVHLAHEITATRRQHARYEQIIAAARQIIESAKEEYHFLPVSPLTEREQAILRLLGEGRAAAQVAGSLGISAQTLRNHLRHVNQKLGTHNRLEAVIHAARRGLI